MIYDSRSTPCLGRRRKIEEKAVKFSTRYFLDMIRDVIVPPFHRFLDIRSRVPRREEGHFRVKGMARNREGIPTKETEWLITRETGFKDFPPCPRDMNS